MARTFVGSLPSSVSHYSVSSTDVSSIGLAELQVVNHKAEGDKPAYTECFIETIDDVSLFDSL